MTPIETKIAALLLDCEGIMKPYIRTAEKWEIIRKKEQQTKTVIDHGASISSSYFNSAEKIKKLKSYIAANEAFGRDKVFAKANKVAGICGTFDFVIHYLLTDTCKIIARRILFNHVEALSKLRQLRDTLTKEHIKYIASTRLIGATITSKRMNLPEKVEIIRLTTKERNDKQALIRPYSSFDMDNSLLADGLLELHLPITIPVDRAQKNAFFKARDNALQSAGKIFGNILDSILIVFKGKAILGAPITLQGGLKQTWFQAPIIQERPPPVNITIRKNDLKNIYTAYDLVSGGEKGDKTLSRALHRFLLGRKRSDLLDKLVDYVISWEALLLTQKGDPIKQELSYRFSLNGASILFATNNRLDRFVSNKKMKAAYSVRSTIVHGGGRTEIDKDLKKGDFNNLQSLCDYIETNFRTTILWLASKDAKNRPYRKQYGWEELIWL